MTTTQPTTRLAPERVAEVSLAAIRHNVARVREASGAPVIAVVKANAYGHGAPLVARAAIEAGAIMLGTADIAEALELRAHGVDAPLLSWMHAPDTDFGAALDADIEIGVSSAAQLARVADAAKRAGSPATVHLKVDTGLNRNGARAEEWPELFASVSSLASAGVVVVRGIFSHLSNTSPGDDAAQERLFASAVAGLREAGVEPELVHIAASAAAFDRPSGLCNAVRIGIAMYGLSPFEDRTPADLGLVPAMTLASQVIGLKRALPGESVSYGYVHRFETPTTLALVSMGYADGVRRSLGERGVCVTIAGEPCPIVGRIAMDQFVVDAGAVAGRVSLGDRVVLFGDGSRGHTTADDWASALGTINYEVLTGVGARVARVPSEELPR